MLERSFYLFTPGPVALPEEVRAIGAQHVPYFRNDAFSEVVFDCERMLLQLTSAPEGSRVVFLTASGTGAMEAAVQNLLRRDRSVVVVNGGTFGQRFVELCHHASIPTEVCLSEGDNLSSGKRLEPFGRDAQALLVNLHETSCGLLYDIDAIDRFCQERNLLNIVDGISAFLTDPVDMTANHIDAFILSSQKGLALPPGLSMVVLSPRAIDAIQPEQAPFYFNFEAYLKDGMRGQTPFTPAVSVILQLHARLKNLIARGLDFEYQRAARCASYFRSHVSRWPLRFYSQHMPNAMTILSPSDGRNAFEIVQYLAEKHRVFVAPNGGALKKIAFRVAHMGDQTEADLDVLIAALDAYYANA